MRSEEEPDRTKAASAGVTVESLKTFETRERRYTDRKTGEDKTYTESVRKLEFTKLGEDQIKHRGLYEGMEPEEVVIPCRRCFPCQKAKVADTALRAQLQAMVSKHAIFLTLTFSDEALWESERTHGYTVHPSDISLFMKRYRRACDRETKKAIQNGKLPPGTKPPKITAFVAAEYGGVNGRPHYHLLIYGWTPSDLRRRDTNKPDDVDQHERAHLALEQLNSEHQQQLQDGRKRKRDKSREWMVSETILKLWGQGSISIAPVTGATAQYTCQYASKKYKASVHEAIEAIQATEDSNSMLIDEEYLVRRRDSALEYLVTIGDEDSTGYDLTAPYQIILDRLNMITQYEAKGLQDDPLKEPSQELRDALADRIKKQIARIATRAQSEHMQMRTPYTDPRGITHPPVEPIADFELATRIFEKDCINALRWAKEHGNIKTPPTRYDVNGNPVPELTQRNAMFDQGDGFTFDPENKDHLLNYRTHAAIRYKRWAPQERKAFKIYSRRWSYKLVEELPARSKAKKIMDAVGTGDIRLLVMTKDQSGNIQYFNAETEASYTDTTEQPNADLVRARRKHSHLLKRFRTEFHTQSTKPPMAAEFFEKYEADIFSGDDVPVIVTLTDEHEPITRPVPSYLMEMLKRVDPHLWRRKKTQIEEAAEDYRETEAFIQSQKPEIRIHKYAESVSKNNRSYDDDHYGKEPV